MAQTGKITRYGVYNANGLSIQYFDTKEEAQRVADDMRKYHKMPFSFRRVK